MPQPDHIPSAARTRPFSELTKDWPLRRRLRVKLRVLWLKWKMREG